MQLGNFMYSCNVISCELHYDVKIADEEGSSDSDSIRSSGSQKNLTEYKKKHQRQGSQDVPPGYVQGMISRIINNVSIIVTNLILKYVEDDIVLSLNVKSAESFTANENWMKEFADISGDLCLRRVITFSDLTLCLDKRNSSGKIEVYQDPLVYKCSLILRILMTYDSEYAKAPTLTKANLYCERVDISMSDEQLPMWIRLTQLVITMYYGLLPAQLKKKIAEKEQAEKKQQHPPQLLGMFFLFWIAPGELLQ